MQRAGRLLLDSDFSDYRDVFLITERGLCTEKSFVNFKLFFFFFLKISMKVRSLCGNCSCSGIFIHKMSAVIIGF